MISELRDNNIHILEKGAIEAYYPAEVTGRDKPSKAQSFCNLINSREQIIELCEQIEIGEGLCTEFELIFQSIFNVF